MFGAVADARPLVSLALHGNLVGHDARGAETLTPVERAALRPGELVRYDIRVANAGADPAEKLIPVGRIPAGTLYKGGSASSAPGTRVEFSTDNGKSWSEKPLVRVQTANGTVEKAASPASYTQVRWVSAKALAPKTSETYHYDVKIK
ncbi:MAG: hypothetical protein GIX03_06690 [Candidatus Eremiobacteraeota bacterium]|nr:hypothetical protein [Candidatus Eremiobacteraeota bacterium]MBC5802681.1 hypothetical protein [Candidatus Eremiobacteraeota bacterium]MBC5822366.1 hypothetical protein [Candidatus Eremiobacteraeota bacterium]